MFEISRCGTLDRPIRQFMATIANDPFFRSIDGAIDEAEHLPLDIEDAGGDIVVTASLPGFSKSDIEVQLHDGVLTISAERKEEKEAKEGTFYRRERRVGSFSRSIALPKSVAFDKANADLKDGVLTVRIPQAESAKPRQIAVN